MCYFKIIVLFFLASSTAFAQNNLRNTSSSSAVNDEYVVILTDRPFYEPEDEVYVSIWVLDAASLKRSKTSEAIRIEVVNAKGEKLKDENVCIKDGIAATKFKLPNIGGIYTIRAFASFTSKLFPDKVVEKIIQVQDIQFASILYDITLDKNIYAAGDSIKLDAVLKNSEGSLLRSYQVNAKLFLDGEVFCDSMLFTSKDGKLNSHFVLPINADFNTAYLVFNVNYGGVDMPKLKIIPIAESEIVFKYRAESGVILEDFESVVAFKVTDLNGNPSKVSGVLVDDLGNQLKHFETVHDGMGKVAFKPTKGRSYKFIVFHGKGLSSSFGIDGITSFGAMLQVPNTYSRDLNVLVRGNGIPNGKLVLRRCDSALMEMQINNIDSQFYRFDVSNVTAGIGMLSLYDHFNNLVCERQVFVNPNNRLHLELKYDKEKYEPGEKVQLKIHLRDQDGNPQKGIVALSIFDGQYEQDAEKYREGFLSGMYLQNELNDKIHLPGYYFQKKDSLTLSHLDLLMLNNGWSRMAWHDNDSMKQHYALKASLIKKQKYVIKGKVFDRSKWEEVDQYRHLLKLEIRETGQVVPVDSMGNFIIWGIADNKPKHLKVTVPGLYGLRITAIPRLSIVDYSANTKAVKYSNDYKIRIDGRIVRFKDDKKLDDSSSDDRKALKETDDAVEIKSDNGESSRDLLMANQSNKINGRGSRTDGTVTYFDGVRVNNSGLASIASSTANSMSYCSISFGRSRSIYPTGFAMLPHSSFITFPEYYHPLEYIPDTSNLLSCYDSVTLFYNRSYSNQYNWQSFENDKRKTLFYAAGVKTNRNGVATIEFYNSSLTGNYRAEVSASGDEGLIGEASAYHEVKSGVLVNFNPPNTMYVGDIIQLPLAIKNDRDEDTKLSIEWTLNNDLFKYEINLPKGKDTVIMMKLYSKLIGELRCGLKIKSRGFQYSNFSRIINLEWGKRKEFVLSGRLNEGKGSLVIPPGSTDIKIEMNVFPDAVQSMLAGFSGMIREPHGCFEQVSSTNYPNILAFEMMNRFNLFKSIEQRKNLLKILQNGYDKLAKYETVESGYEWFGNLPPNARLSAYGLLQFHDMKKLGVNVSAPMEKRVSNWLIAQLKPEGGIKFDKGGFHSSTSSEVVTTAYVIWTLSQVSDINIDKQISFVRKSLNKKFDAYVAAFLADIYINRGQRDSAMSLMKVVLGNAKNYNWDELPCEQTITNSYGISKKVEMLSMLAINMMKLDAFELEKNLMMTEIMKSRGSNNCFGSTQSTVLGLKAMGMWMEDSLVSKGSRFWNMNFTLNGAKEEYTMENSGIYQGFEMPITNIRTGLNTFSFKTDCSMNTTYTYAVTWKQDSDTISNADIESEIVKFSNKISPSDYQEMILEVSNKSRVSSGQTVCIMPLPTGAQLNPEQLKQLVDNGKIQYYEIRDNELHLYFLDIDPLSKRSIPINIRFSLPGKIVMPVMKTYQYYYPEAAHYSKVRWVDVE